MADYTPEEWALIHAFDMEGPPPVQPGMEDTPWSDEDKLAYMQGQEQVHGEFMGEQTGEMGQFGADELEYGKRHLGVLNTSDEWTLEGFALPDEMTDMQAEAVQSGEDPQAAKWASGLVNPEDIGQVEKGGIYAFGAHNAQPDLFFHEGGHHEFEKDDPRVRQITDEMEDVRLYGDKAREEIAVRTMELFRAVGAGDARRVNSSLADFGYRVQNLGEKSIGHVDDVVEFIDKLAPTLAEMEAEYYLANVGVPEELQPYDFTDRELKDKTREFLEEWKRRKEQYMSPDDLESEEQ